MAGYTWLGSNKTYESRLGHPRMSPSKVLRNRGHVLRYHLTSTMNNRTYPQQHIFRKTATKNPQDCEALFQHFSEIPQLETASTVKGRHNRFNHVAPHHHGLVKPERESGRTIFYHHYDFDNDGNRDELDEEPQCSRAKDADHHNTAPTRSL